jgi:hypothetical protein
MKKWIPVQCLIVCMLGSIAAAAQDANKISVAVKHSGNDSVGERLAFSLKEKIRSSKGYALVSDTSALSR